MQLNSKVKWSVALLAVLIASITTATIVHIARRTRPAALSIETSARVPAQTEAWLDPNEFSGEDKPRSWAEDAEQFNREKVGIVAVLMNPDRVEPFRIEPSLEMEQGLDNQEILYKAKLLGRSASIRIATLLLDPKSYDSPGRSDKMCAFQPRLAFRYWQGQRFLDVLFCFECDQVMVVERDPEVPFRSLGGLVARFRVAGDFDPIREKLKLLMAEAFPGDPDLKGILDPHNLSSEAPTAPGEETPGKGST